jgi:hypothetical protein
VAVAVNDYDGDFLPNPEFVAMAVRIFGPSGSPTFALLVLPVHILQVVIVKPVTSLTGFEQQLVPGGADRAKAL